MQFSSVLAPDDARTRLERLFPQEHAQASLSPMPKLLLRGTYQGYTVRLMLMDQSQAGWLAPIFEGEISAQSGGCRLAGILRYDPNVLAMMVLGSLAFSTVVLTLAWQITHSLTGLLGAVGVVIVSSAILESAQANVTKRLCETISSALDSSR